MDIKDLVIYRNLEHQELFRDKLGSLKKIK